MNDGFCFIDANRGFKFGIWVWMIWGKIDDLIWEKDQKGNL